MHTKPWAIVYIGGTADTALLRDLLDATGIPSQLGDEVMGTMAPYVIAAGNTTGVKVLVPEDRVEDAREIVVDFVEQSKRDSEPTNAQFLPWVCPCCHESNDGTFDICWNCQTERA